LKQDAGDLKSQRKDTVVKVGKTGVRMDKTNARMGRMNLRMNATMERQEGILEGSRFDTTFMCSRTETRPWSDCFE
jgi:hypothetical protein